MNARRTLPRWAALVAFACAPLACAPEALLGPDAEQGIDGLALRGPLCPVVSAESPCPDEPFQAWVGIYDEGGTRIARVRSGTDGRFRVGLRPGRYRLEGESGTPFPRGGEEEAVVRAGVWAPVTVHFDTGIR